MGTMADMTYAQVLKKAQGFLTEGKGREGIIGSWRGQSKGPEVGRPGPYLTRGSSVRVSGELEVWWGALGIGTGKGLGKRTEGLGCAWRTGSLRPGGQGSC